MGFPIAPATGKGSKVMISSGDGTSLSLTAMTLQASYVYKGTTYTNRAYLLGTGKTLMNMRPEVEPEILIDGIIDGLVISPHASNDKVVTSAGTIIVDGVEVAVSADTDISVSRPAATQGAWVAITVTEAGAVAATKGTDTTAGTGIAALVDTFGAAAGEKPLIPVDELLIGYLKLTNGAAVVLSTEIFYNNRENADIDPQVLPNLGGVLLPAALDKMHTGGIARDVKFTGYYLDNVLSEISTAKGWSTNPAVNTVTDTTFSRGISITELGAWSFSFEQLAADPKVLNIIFDRQGFGAVRLIYPNGFYFQGAASLGATFSAAPGSLNPIPVTGSFLDEPAKGNV